MTLKSSEIKNFLSWWISTILKYFLVSSAFCLCTRPLFIRPMLRSFKIVPKMIFNLENSITPSSSRSRLPWRRRVLSCFDTGWSMTNNLVVQYRSKFFPQWVQFLWMNWQKYVFAFCFYLWSARKSKYIRFSKHNLRTAFPTFPARCRRAPCFSIPWPTYSSREKFWPKSENCPCLLTQL